MCFDNFVIIWIVVENRDLSDRKRSDFDLSQLLLRYLVGAAVQIISLELEMRIFRNYHVKLIHLMVRSLSCFLQQSSIVWHLLIVEKCILGDLEEGAVWGILILTYTGIWSIIEFFGNQNDFI